MIRKKWKHFLISAALLAIIFVSIERYDNYIGQKFYQESTQGLFATYEQLDKTFLMFVQRNWNALEDWCNYLNYCVEEQDKKERNAEDGWGNFVNDRKNWQYSDFYVFNEDCEFWTIDGRRGTAEHVKAAFKELYEKKGPIVSSYVASDGETKILFAVPSDPIELKNVTYTAFAVSYDNSVVEKMIGGGVYNNKSDCYIVDSDGTVLMSLEPETQITDDFDNIFDFIQEKTQSYNKDYLERMKKTVPTKGKGSISFKYQKSEYYLVYQPVGIDDWSIVGIVEKSVVDSGMRMVQGTTIVLLCMMAICIMIGVVILMKQRANAQLQKEADERIKAEKKKEISEQLFLGISQIVDCFAICDLENNRYEYEDKRGEYLYPKKGAYDQFIKEISDQYTILTDGENAKFTNMLSVWNVRQLIKGQKDSYCLEYCARDKSRFFIMNVIPVEWEGDTLTKIMLVTQDMGQQHELENLANTDALTGLFNKRYFEKMMEIRDEKKKPYALFYMDLDLFKPVNDTYGHEMGDKVLKEVAKRLLKCIRSNDYAFRIGGDEFMLILNGNLDAQLCEKRIERIKKLIGEPYEFDGHTIKIGISCGSAVYPDDADCAADIQKIADKRMYEDKKINHAKR